MSGDFQMVNKTLVFPGGTTEAERYRQEASARGELLVGASSLRDDLARSLYDEWLFLPSVHKKEFLESFLEGIKSFKINTIYCSHSILYDALTDILQDENLDVQLLNEAPTDADNARMISLLDRAKNIHTMVLSIASPGSRAILNEIEIASVIMFCSFITGQSSDEKLAAMLAVYLDMPEGDIVEIGAFWGRSTFLLTWGAQRYGIGKVLAVDPWQAIYSRQNDSPDLVQRDTLRQDWDTICKGFQVALSIFGPSKVNFLRASSDKAIHTYIDCAEVSNDSYGTTQFTKKIALIHIDGNHDYESVVIDRDTWCPFVQAGGWIVFDDYVWEHGDGPKKAADEFLITNVKFIDRTFVCGKALFIKIKN